MAAGQRVELSKRDARKMAYLHLSSLFFKEEDITAEETRRCRQAARQYVGLLEKVFGDRFSTTECCQATLAIDIPMYGQAGRFDVAATERGYEPPASTGTIRQTASLNT